MKTRDELQAEQDLFYETVILPFMRQVEDAYRARCAAAFADAGYALPDELPDDDGQLDFTANEEGVIE